MTSSFGDVWRHLWARLIVALPCAWFTTAVLIFGAPVSLKIPVAATLILSLASPYYGLLVVAACVPLTDYAGTLLNLGSYRLGEALTVAFLTAWLVRGESERRGPRVASAVGWTVAAILVASMAVTAARSSDALRSTIQWAFYGYYLTTDTSGWVDGARLLEGLALVAAVFSVLRRRPQLAVTLPAALAVSVTAAGLTSILLWFRIAPPVILQAPRAHRLSIHRARC